MHKLFAHNVHIFRPFVYTRLAQNYDFFVCVCAVIAMCAAFVINIVKSIRWTPARVRKYVWNDICFACLNRIFVSLVWLAVASCHVDWVGRQRSHVWCSRINVNENAIRCGVRQSTIEPGTFRGRTGKGPVRTSGWVRVRVHARFDALPAEWPGTRTNQANVREPINALFFRRFYALFVIYACM